MERSVIKLVLPLELPPEVQRHEDITPAMVQSLGLQEDEASKKAQDHYALVYTDYEGKRRLTIYAERREGLIDDLKELQRKTIRLEADVPSRLKTLLGIKYQKRFP